MKRIITTAVAVILMATSGMVSAADKVTLPKGYEKWERSKDKTVTDKSSLFYGIHNIYVDAKAMKPYKGGSKYPEGSQFVVAQYSIRDEGGKPAKGKKSMVVLMRRDKRQQGTGGWLFAGFTPEGKPSGLDPVKNCFECHAKDAAATEFVISRYSDFK
jgi:hypothetical protein